MISRNKILSLFILTILVLAGCATAEGKVKKINIGYQKNGTMLSLKRNQEFIEELEGLGYKVSWSEFSTGSSILEALNAGSIDFAGAGDIPSIFALEKGSDFRYIGTEPDTPHSEGILVGKDSGIKTVEDLKGKRIAFNNASIAQYLLTKALDRAGLTLDDVDPVLLNPPEANVAFEQGEIDAWVVWDPYLSVSESRGNVVIQTAEGVVPYRSFYFGTPSIVEESPEAAELFIKYLSETGKKIDEDPQEAARLMEEETKIDAKTWKRILLTKKSNVQYMNEEAVDDLQTQVADLVEIGLLESEININNYIWHPDK